MKRKYIILLHIACWGLLLVTNLWQATSTSLFSPSRSHEAGFYSFFKYMVIEITYLLIPLSCFYGSYLVVAPQFVKKNYFKTILYAFLLLMFVIALRYLMEYKFFLPVFGFDNYNGHPYTISRFVANVFFYYFPAYFVYGLMYFFVEGWYKTRQNQQELQKEKAAAELTFLRSQINPHFLFNSINDIYSLTYQKSEDAPGALLKLSEILRYMLREGNEDFVPLEQEVKYIENVIELQRISAKGNAFINFDIEGYIGIQKMAALLFIAFVENAFKHGVWNDATHPIQINLDASNDKIQFGIRNKKNNDLKDKTGGIGLNNVRRRLELIYPGKHQLDINAEAEFYTVNLKLQLI
jgi:two-component system LytT family sensor kinase